MLVSELIDRLGRRIPWDRASSWDVNGLHIGDATAETGTVAVCHEITDAVTQRAIDHGVGTLVTYHPLLFEAIRGLKAGGGPQGRAYRLVRAGVTVIVAHTAFDVATPGTGDGLAQALGLGDVRGFGTGGSAALRRIVTFVPGGHVDEVADAMAAAGAGTVGNYTGCAFEVEGFGRFTAEEGAAPVVGARGVNREVEVRLEMTCPASRSSAVLAALVAAHPYEEPVFDLFDVTANEGFIGRIGTIDATLGELADTVGAVCGVEALRVAGDRSTPLRTVAVVPGSGSSFLADASGADAIVTGDVSHHHVVAALARGMAVIDPGHTGSERPGVRTLVDVVGEAAGTSVEFIDIDPSPWGSQD